MSDSHMYLLKLPKKIDSYTHIAVERQFQNRGLIEVAGQLGRLTPSGAFVANSLGQDHTLRINGRALVDFQEQVRGVEGRPVDLPSWEFRHTDVEEYHQSDPQVRKDRMDARDAAAEEAAVE